MRYAAPCVFGRVAVTDSLKILAVDDDVQVLDALKRILAGTDHELDCYQDARSALEGMKNCSYDFLLVDYKMPDKDGMWFMRHAQVPATTKSLLITAYASAELINQMFKLGISGYIIKPFDRAELMRHLDYHSHSDD